MYHMFLIPPPLTVTTLFYPCSSAKQVLAPYKPCSSFIKVPTVKKTICPTGRPRWHLTKMILQNLNSLFIQINMASAPTCCPKVFFFHKSLPRTVCTCCTVVMTELKRVTGSAVTLSKLILTILDVFLHKLIY